MLDVILPVFVLIAIGYALRRFGLLKQEDALRLVNIIVYVTFPATLFLGLSRTRLPEGVLKIPVYGLAAMFAAMLVLAAVCRALKIDRASAGSVVVASAFGNTAFLGVPLSFAAFGDGGRVSAIIYDLLGVSIALYTIGFGVLEAYAGRPFSWKAMLAILRTPFFIAAVAAVVVRLLTPWWNTSIGQSWLIGRVFVETLERLAPMTAPLAMLALGVNLRFSALREFLPLLGLSAAAKLALMPAVVYVLVSVAGPHNVAGKTAVLEAAMPSGLVVGVVCGRFGCNARLGAAITFATTLASMATLPLWTWLLGR
jgi:malate permease and related proteins